MSVLRPGVTGVVLPLAALVAWQLLTSVGVLDLQFLPAPSEIGRVAATEAVDGELAADLAHTLAIVLIATIAAGAIGGSIGVALGLVPGLRMHFAASLEFLRTVPAIALMPVALLLLGARPTTELLLAAYAATWPVLVTTAAGVAGVPDRLRDVARTLRFSPARTIGRIILPAAASSWLAGARVAAIVALHVAVIAEMVISPAGLGGGLVESLQGLNPPRMWAYVAVCGLLGVLLQGLLRRLIHPALQGGDGVPRVSMRNRDAVLGLLPLVAGLACWQLLGPSGSRTFPPPSRWTGSLAQLYLDGLLVDAVASTLTTFVAALAAATVIGFALGLAIGLFHRVDRVVSPTLDLLAAIPGAVLVPLAILALGTTRATAVAVVALAVVWPVLHTSAAAARAIPPVRLDAARTLGLSRTRRWRTVLLPSIAPAVLVGVRVAASMALIVTLLVDILGTGGGIGRLLVERQQRFDTAGAWGLLFAIGGLGYLINLALARAERLLARITGRSAERPRGNNT